MVTKAERNLRLLRIENRNTIRRAHLPILEVQPEETTDQAIARAFAAGYYSIGMVLPKMISSIEEWEKSAQEYYRTTTPAK